MNTISNGYLQGKNKAVDSTDREVYKKGMRGWKRRRRVDWGGGERRIKRRGATAKSKEERGH